jgi:hypothetical protein
MLEHRFFNKLLNGDVFPRIIGGHLASTTANSDLSRYRTSLTMSALSSPFFGFCEFFCHLFSFFRAHNDVHSEKWSCSFPSLLASTTTARS